MANPDEIEHRAELLRRRLHILTALQTSLERADEVFAAIRAGRDRDEAIVAVRELLGLDGIQADAVLEQQWRGLTRDRAETLSADIVADRRTLASLTGRDPSSDPGL